MELGDSLTSLTPESVEVEDTREEKKEVSAKSRRCACHCEGKRKMKFEEIKGLVNEVVGAVGGVSEEV